MRVAVMVSGAGSTFAALVAAARDGRLRADVALLIASRPDAPALERARDLGVPHAVVDARQIGADSADAAIDAALRAHDIDLVVLAGYLRKLGPLTLASFDGRIVNSHPAPLPRFGGQGMYGDHVHRAVLDAGVAESAATVHHVDGEYDHGATIAAVTVPVLAGDGVDSLRARVQAAERELLIDTIVTLTMP